MPTALFEATYFIIDNDYMKSYLLQLIGDMKDVLTRLDSDLLIYIGILECVCVFFIFIFFFNWGSFLCFRSVPMITCLLYVHSM